MLKNIKVYYIECYITCTNEDNLELQSTEEKEHIMGDSTIQDILVKKVSKNNRSLQLLLFIRMISATKMNQKDLIRGHQKQDNMS